MTEVSIISRLKISLIICLWAGKIYAERMVLNLTPNTRPPRKLLGTVR